MKFAHFSQLFNKVGMETPARYEQMWREVELADELGFDYGFQSVHHFHKLRPTPAVYCTGAAARTKRMRLGPMGYTAGLHDPISILEETLVLDNVTNGRFELGLGLRRLSRLLPCARGQPVHPSRVGQGDGAACKCLLQARR